MQRLILAFQSFFALLFTGSLPDGVAAALGLVPAGPPPKEEPPKPLGTPREDGAVQLLAILQRDSRLVDFLMEDIAGYSDDQVGAAVRALHSDCAKALERYVKLTPVVDAVEGDYAAMPAIEAGNIKLLGNVPSQGKPKGGILRHRGWKADRIELPAPQAGLRVVAPAELEVQ